MSNDDCSREILEKLTKQDKKLDTYASKQSNFITKTEIWQDSATIHMTNVDIALNGNGRPGMKLEIDRLKQTEVARGKILWLTMGAALAGIAMQTASHFGSS